MKEQKSNSKKEKGITLIALIITIVVLLILASVSIGAIKDSKIITHAQDAKKTYTEAQIKEEIELFSVEYLIATNRNMAQNTKDKMIGIITNTGVKPEQLTVHYDLYTKEEIILYKIAETTKEEQKILENAGIYPLRGDIDQDGYLTNNDYDYIQGYAFGVMDMEDMEDIENLAVSGKYLTPEEIDEWYDETIAYMEKYGDLDGDDSCDYNDVPLIEAILRGESGYIFLLFE